MPPPLRGSGVIASGNDGSVEGIAPCEMVLWPCRSEKNDRDTARRILTK